MIFNVQLLAFMEGDVRPVIVPNDEVPIKQDSEHIAYLLERIFYWGQNDFQAVPGRCSVSVGDVAEVYGKFYIVRDIGWAEISAADLELYKQIPRRDRTFSEYVRPKLSATLYEVNDDGEATGTVHPFCSLDCRDDCELDRTQWKAGFCEVVNFPKGTVCETCGKEL